VAHNKVHTTLISGHLVNASLGWLHCMLMVSRLHILHCIKYITLHRMRQSLWHRLLLLEHNRVLPSAALYCS
jgi:hypothetical protein